jgi:hypothetical protein
MEVQRIETSLTLMALYRPKAMQFIDKIGVLE